MLQWEVQWMDYWKTYKYHCFTSVGLCYYGFAECTRFYWICGNLPQCQTDNLNSMYIFGIVCHTKLLLEVLERNNVVHNHDTRQELNLHVQFCRTNAYKKGILNMGIKLYNKVPNKFREVEKLV
jgi:hypothetical protein